MSREKRKNLIIALALIIAGVLFYLYQSQPEALKEVKGSPSPLPAPKIIKRTINGSSLPSSLGFISLYKSEGIGDNVSEIREDGFQTDRLVFKTKASIKEIFNFYEDAFKNIENFVITNKVSDNDYAFLAIEGIEGNLFFNISKNKITNENSVEIIYTFKQNPLKQR